MDARVYESLMKRIPLCAELSPAEMQELVAGAKLLRVQPETRVISAGVAGGAMYMLMEGTVRIERPMPDGSLATLTEESAPAVLGEMAMIDDGPRTAHVVTTSPCVMLQIPKEGFQALRNNGRPAAYKVLRQMAHTLSRRLDEKTRRIVSFFEDFQGVNG